MRDLLRWFFNPWVLGGAFLVSLLLLAVTAGLVWLTRPAPGPAAGGTAAINLIAATTATPVPPTPAATSTTAATQPAAAGELPPSPQPGTINLEAYIQITGTGGDGLRLRTDPGLETEVRTLGAESEVFLVKDGPKEVDGMTWWYLEGVVDATRRGWAASNYLEIVQQP